MLKKFQLKNGLKILLFESHKSPVVSIQSWVRTGSADESKGEEGISHFIEHLLFKSTKKFNVGEIASLVEGSGGELNAYTSFDQTVFYVTISKQFTDLGLEVISEMMGYPQFIPQEIDPEREVVVEEIKRGEDSPGQKASKLLFSTAYAKHPYRRPVIGFEKNIRMWSDKKLREYYWSRYSPKNMFLVIAGDFHSDEIKKKIKNYFCEIPSTKIKKSNRGKEPSQKKFKVSVEQASFEQSLLYVSWKIPIAKHQDIPALDLLALILGQGESSRLVKKLRIDKAVVNSIGSSLFSAQDQGLFVISMGYNKENLKEALSGVKECIQKIITGEISDEEIRKAITNIESEQFYASETVDGLARQVGQSEFLMHRPDYLKKYLSQIRKVTEKKIKQVAKKYLNPQTMTLACLTNEKKQTTKKTLEVWAKTYTKDYIKYKVLEKTRAKLKLGKTWTTNLGSKKSELKIVPLSTGVRVLLRRTEDTHTVCARAAFLGGVRAEDLLKEGEVELLGRTWTGGTANLSELEISQTIESMASGLSPVCGRNSMGLSLESLVPFESAAADLFIEVLSRPIFPSEIVEREKLVQLEQIKTKKDNPAQMCSREFMRKLFKGHPLGKDMLGTEDSLRTISSRNLMDLWKSTAQRRNLTIIVTGHIKEDLWLKKLESGLESLEEGQKFNKIYPVEALEQDEKSFIELKKEQSHLICGFHGLSLMDQSKYTLHVIQSILAGMGGRLFIELREKNSLAYSVSPLSQEGLEKGYFGAYIACSPDKVQKALEMMKVEFEKLCEQKVSEKELNRAKKYLVGRHDIDLQRTSSLASSILYNEIYGLDPLETFKVAEHYFSVTPEDILSVANRIFKQKSVVSLVGPKGSISW